MTRKIRKIIEYLSHNSRSHNIDFCHIYVQQAQQATQLLRKYQKKMGKKEVLKAKLKKKINHINAETENDVRFEDN